MLLTMNYLKGFDVLRITDFKFRKDGSGVKIVVDNSDRLQLLEPLKLGKNITGAKLLIKALGNALLTISAGPWLRFRGI
jgi:hypothetical protein